eukprot:6178816-Pleurochrysis_carterae.AAC.1
MSANERCSAGPKRPVRANPSEKTMVSPANGASTESGKSASTMTSNIVARMPSRKKPSSHLGEQYIGPSASLADRMSRRPEADERHPRGIRKTAVGCILSVSYGDHLLR